MWELTQGAAREDALWYAGLLWSEPDIDHIAALGQAMLAQKLYFKFSPPFFEALSAAQVEQKKEKQQQEARLNELVQGGTEFFRKIYAARRGPEGAGKDAVQPPAAAEELRDMLLRHIADPYAYEQDNTWGTIAKNISGKNAGEDQFCLWSWPWPGGFYLNIITICWIVLITPPMRIGKLNTPGYALIFSRRQSAAYVLYLFSPDKGLFSA